jgi:hypothetical protein
VMKPFRSLVMMASCENWTTAAKRCASFNEPAARPPGKANRRGTAPDGSMTVM